MNLKMKRTISEKMMMRKQRKKGSSDEDQMNAKNMRFLVTVNVLGSAGPLRFLVNENDLVGGVIDASLKRYAHEGRLPALGLASGNFLLYSANAGADGTFIYRLISSAYYLIVVVTGNFVCVS